MAGFGQLDPEFKEKLKKAGQKASSIKQRAISGTKSYLDTMHSQGVPTGPARQRMNEPPGAASSPSNVATNKITQNTRRPSLNKTTGVTDPMAYETPSAGYAKNIMESNVFRGGRPLTDPNAKASYPLGGSTIFNKARENLSKQMDWKEGLTKEGSNYFGPARNVGGRDVYDEKGNVLESASGGASFPDSGFGSPFVKDPVTGKMIEKAGYYNEAGTFIEGPRIKPWETGTMINYATRGITDPAIRERISEGIMKQAGVTPETEGMGAGLNRALEERLTQSKLSSAERIANITTKGDIEKTGILANTPYYQDTGSGGSQSQENVKWTQSEDGTWYNEKSRLSPPEQVETKLAEDIMTRWKRHQGDINSFYKTLSDEESKVFKKYYQ